MMREYYHQEFGKWRDLLAHGLLFLSMIAGLSVFGAVFVSDHDRQVYALYDRADDFTAQAYQSYQNQVYALSNKADDLSAGLSAQISSQARAFSGLAVNLSAQVSSNYNKQVSALSAGVNDLSAQIHSAYSEHQTNYLSQQARLLRPPRVYSRPLVRFNYSDIQFNEIFNQLEKLSRLR